MSSHSPQGFSLIELMIALAIATIIAAIAIPGYRDYMMRARIPEATSTLSALAMRLEQHYQDHHGYGDKNGCGVAMPADEFFTFQCAPQHSGQSFLLTASGKGKGEMSEFTFTLDQNGNAKTIQLPEAWGTTPTNCWIAKRGATC
jgi:type IV pilus assembly protein PilE